MCAVPRNALDWTATRMRTGGLRPLSMLLSEEKEMQDHS